MLLEYEKHFDIVIVNDGNLHFLNELITKIGHYEGKAAFVTDSNPYYASYWETDIINSKNLF